METYFHDQVVDLGSASALNAQALTFAFTYPGPGVLTAAGLHAHLVIGAKTQLRAWAESYGLPAAANPATTDTDKDGLTDLLEWGLGSSPVISGATPVAAAAAVAAAAGTLQFTWPRSVAAFDAGTAFTVEWSDTLAGGTWHTDSVTSAILSTAGGLQQMRSTLPATGPRRYVRLRVDAPP